MSKKSNREMHGERAGAGSADNLKNAEYSENKLKEGTGKEGSDKIRKREDKERNAKTAGLKLLQERIKELEEENSALKDQLLRKQADFENFRKRMSREKEDSIRYANSKLLLDLTGIIDDFERAIQSAEVSKDFEAFLQGISLIEKQMTAMLENRWGLKRFSSQGEKFDPDKHEAIASEESESYKDSVVLEDYQKGYYLHERLLRPARVKVAKPVAVLGKKGGENLEQAEDNKENKNEND